MPEQEEKKEEIKIHVPRSLDSIQLPEEDAAKPAEINLNEDEGDADVAPDPETVAKEKADADAAAKKEADEKATKDKEAADAKAAADAGKTPEELKADAAAAKAKEDEDKKKELTPFHEHPDWKKMQEENAALREKVAKTEGQVEVLLASKNTTTDDKKQALKSAEERLQEDLDNGWKPASALEITQRNNKYMREELEAKEKQAKEDSSKENDVVADTAKKYNAAIESTMSELKVPEAEEGKIFARVTELRSKGIVSPTPENIGEILKLAHRELKAESVIGVQPAKTAEELKAEEDAKAAAAAAEAKKKEEEDKKKQTNGRVNRGNGSGDGGGNKPEKKPLSQLRRTLDDIVLDHRSELDGN